MQSTPDISAISSRLSLDTDVPYSDSDLVKKLRLSVNVSEGRNSCERVDTSSSSGAPADSGRDQVAPATPTDSCDKHYFHASLVGDKYLLLDQVDSSSLYRCVNVQTQQKLVCKVKIYLKDATLKSEIINETIARRS